MVFYSCHDLPEGTDNGHASWEVMSMKKDTGLGQANLENSKMNTAPHQLLSTQKFNTFKVTDSTLYKSEIGIKKSTLETLLQDLHGSAIESS